MSSIFLKEDKGGEYFNDKEKTVKKQSKCPSMGDLKIVVRHTVDYYSAVKKEWALDTRDNPMDLKGVIWVTKPIANLT